eukprot:jgi/Bigna1/71644/fgenesh1_pg.16_\
MASEQYIEKQVGIFQEGLDQILSSYDRARKNPKTCSVGFGIQSSNAAINIRRRLKVWLKKNTYDLDKKIKGGPYEAAMRFAAERLYRLRAYSEARQCYGMILRSFLSRTDDFSVVSTLDIVRSIEAKIAEEKKSKGQLQDLKKLSGALFMRAMSAFYDTISEDPNLLEQRNFDAVMACLEAIRHTIQLILNVGDEEHCHLLYNGSCHMFELVNAMTPFSRPLKIVEFLTFSVISIETSVPLLTARYVPWRTRLYIAIAKLYHQAGKIQAALNTITSEKYGGLPKVLNLKSLENIDGNIPIQKAYTIDMCQRALESEKFKYTALLEAPDKDKIKTMITGFCKTEQHAIYTLAQTCVDPRRKIVLNKFAGFGKHPSFDQANPYEDEQTALTRLVDAAFERAMPFLKKLASYLLPDYKTGDDEDEGAPKMKITHYEAQKFERNVPLTTHMSLVRSAFSVRAWAQFKELVEIALIRLDQHEYLSSLVIQKILPIEQVTAEDIAAWQYECHMLQSLAPMCDCKVDEESALKLIESMNAALKGNVALQRHGEIYEDTAYFLWTLPVKVWIRQLNKLELALNSKETPANEVGGLREKWSSKRDLLVKSLMAMHETFHRLDYADALARCGVALEVVELLQLCKNVKGRRRAQRVCEETLHFIQKKSSADVIRLTKIDGFGLVKCIRSDFDMRVRIPPFHPLLPRTQASRVQRDLPVPTSRAANMLASYHTSLLFKYFKLTLAVGFDRATKKARTEYKTLVDEQTYMAPFKSTFHPMTAQLKLPETSKSIENHLIKLCGTNSTWKALLFIQIASFRRECHEQHELLLKASQCLRAAEEEERHMLTRVGISLVDTRETPTFAQQFLLKRPTPPRHAEVEIEKIVHSSEGDEAGKGDEYDRKSSSKILPAPLLVTRSLYSVVLRPIIPQWYINRFRLRGFIVYGKEASTGTNVSQIDCELLGTGVEHQLPPKGANMVDVEVSCLDINTPYSFAVVGVNKDGEIVADRGAIGATSKPIQTALPVPLHTCWGFLAVAAAKANYPAVAGFLDKALHRFARGRCQVECIPTAWKDRLHFQMLDSRAIYLAPEPNLHLLVKLLLLRSDTYDSKVPSLKSGKYVSPIGHVEGHVLRQARPLLLALQVAMVARDEEVASSIIERIYNHIVQILPDCERSGLGQATLQVLIPCYIGASLIREKMAPRDWTESFNAATARVLFELTKLYRGLGESSSQGDKDSNIMTRFIKRHLSHLQRASIEDEKEAAAAKEKAAKLQEDFKKRRAEALEEAKQEIEAIQKEREEEKKKREEAGGGKNDEEEHEDDDMLTAEEIAAQRVPDVDISFDPDRRSCYRCISEDRALAIFLILLDNEALSKEGSELCKVSWASWLRFSKNTLRAAGFDERLEGWKMKKNEGEDDFEAQIFEAMQKATRTGGGKEGTLDDVHAKLSQKKEHVQYPMLLARLCSTLLLTSTDSVEGDAASSTYSKALGWLQGQNGGDSNVPPLQLQNPSLRYDALAAVHEQIKRVVAEHGPCTPTVAIDTGVSSSDWMHNFVVTGRVKPTFDPAGIVHKCGPSSDDPNGGGFLLVFRKGHLCFRFAGQPWIKGPAMNMGEWNNFSCEYNRTHLTLTCNATSSKAEAGLIAFNTVQLRFALGDFGKHFRGEIHGIKLVRGETMAHQQTATADVEEKEKEEEKKDGEESKDNAEKTTQKLTAYQLLWLSEIERLKAICSQEKLIRLRCTNRQALWEIVKASGDSTAAVDEGDKKKGGSDGKSEGSNEEIPSKGQILSTLVYGCVGIDEHVDWGALESDDLGVEWRKMTDFAASHSLAPQRAKKENKDGEGDQDAEGKGEEKKTEEEKNDGDGETAEMKQEDPVSKAAAMKELLRKKFKPMHVAEVLVAIDIWRSASVACMAASSARAWIQLQNTVRVFWNSISSMRARPYRVAQLSRIEGALRQQGGKKGDENAKSNHAAPVVEHLRRMGEAILEMLARLSAAAEEEEKEEEMEGGEERKKHDNQNSPSTSSTCYPSIVVQNSPEFASARARELGPYPSVNNSEEKLLGNKCKMWKDEWRLAQPGHGELQLNVLPDGASSDGGEEGGKEKQQLPFVCLGISGAKSIGSNSYIIEISGGSCRLLRQSVGYTPQERVVLKEVGYGGDDDIDLKSGGTGGLFSIRVDSERVVVSVRKRSSSSSSAASQSSSSSTSSDGSSGYRELLTYTSAEIKGKRLTFFSLGGNAVVYKQITMLPSTDPLQVVPSHPRKLEDYRVEQISLNNHLVTVEDSAAVHWYTSHPTLSPQLEWISNVILFILEVLFHDERWEQLVELGLAFNHLTENIEERRVTKLLVFAQRELMTRATAKRDESAFELKELTDNMESKEKAILKRKQQLRSQRGKKEQDRLLAEERAAFEAKRAVIVPELEARTIVSRHAQDTYQQFINEATVIEREMRKFLLVLEKARYYLTQHSTHNIDQAATAIEGFGVATIISGSEGAGEEKSGGSVVSGATRPVTKASTMTGTRPSSAALVSSARVARTYKQSIQQLRQKRESVLMSRALLELGSFFFSKNEIDSASQQWKAGVDCIFLTLDAASVRRKIMYSSPSSLIPEFASHTSNTATQTLPIYPLYLALAGLRPEDVFDNDDDNDYFFYQDRGGTPEGGNKKADQGLVERFGFWNCVTGMMLLATAASHTCAENVQQRLDNVLFGAALGASLFAGSLQHPVRLCDFKAHSQPLDLWPGFGPHLFADESRLRVGQLMDTCRFLADELVRVTLPIRALPILSLYSYLSSSICRSLMDHLISRVLRCEALVDAGFLSEVFTEYTAIIRGANLPTTLPFPGGGGFSVREMLLGEGAAEEGQKQQQHKYCDDLSPGENKAAVDWLLGGGDESGGAEPSAKIKKLYGSLLVNRVRAVRAKMLAKIAHNINTLRRYEAGDVASEEAKLQQSCFEEAVKIYHEIIDATNPSKAEEEKEEDQDSAPPTQQRYSIHNLHMQIRCLLACAEVEEARLLLSNAVELVERAADLLAQADESIEAKNSKKLPPRRESLSRAAPGIRDWNEVKMMLLRLLMKQGRMEEAQALISAIAPNVDRVHDSASLTQIELARLAMQMFKGAPLQETLSTAGRLWELFTASCVDPVPEFMKSISLKKKKRKHKQQKNGIEEAAGSLTQLKWVRLPAVSEMPTLGFQYGRGLMFLSHTLASLYNLCGEDHDEGKDEGKGEGGGGGAGRGIKWDTLVVAEQAELMFQIVSSTFGVDISPALMADLQESFDRKVAKTLVAADDASLEEEEKGGEGKEERKAEIDARAELKRGVNPCLEKYSSKPMKLPINIHLPYVFNMVASTLQFAGALAAQGHLEEALAKAVCAERYSMMCASVDPLFQARSNALIACILWARVETLAQISQTKSAERHASLAHIERGAAIPRPTTSKHMPDRTLEQSHKLLTAQLREIMRRLIQAAEAHIAYDNDLDAIHLCFATAAEVHRFAADNLVLSEKDNDERRRRMMAKEATQALRQKEQLANSVWGGGNSGGDAMATSPLQNVDQLPMFIVNEIKEIGTLNQALCKAQLVQGGKGSRNSPDMDKKKGKNDQGAIEVTSRRVLQYLQMLRYQNAAIADTAHAEKVLLDQKVCALHHYLVTNFAPYKERCCFEAAALQYSAEPSLPPSLKGGEGSFNDWKEACTKPGFVCVQWVHPKAETFRTCVGPTDCATTSGRVSMIYLIVSAAAEAKEGAEGDDSQQQQRQRGCASFPREAVVDICNLAGDIRVLIEEEQQEKQHADVSGFRSTAIERKRRIDQQTEMFSALMQKIALLMTGSSTDTCRGYLAEEEMKAACDKLFSNEEEAIRLRNILQIEKSFQVGLGAAIVNDDLQKVLARLLRARGAAASSNS